MDIIRYFPSSFSTLYTSNFPPRFSTSYLINFSLHPSRLSTSLYHFSTSYFPVSHHISMRRRSAAEGMVADPVIFPNPTAEFSGLPTDTGEILLTLPNFTHLPPTPQNISK